MADKANVTNVDALERFRTSLMLFLEKATSSLNEVTEEVKRTRIWLQTEQKLNLQREIHRKNNELDQIEAELYAARLANASERKAGLQMMRRRKKAELRELEEKIRAVKKWLQYFDSKVEVEARKVDKLQAMIDGDMSRAVRFLNEAAKALHDYSSNTEGPPPKS